MNVCNKTLICSLYICVGDARNSSRISLYCNRKTVAVTLLSIVQVGQKGASTKEIYKIHIIIVPYYNISL